MRFCVNHSRGFMGQDISVTVGVDGSETIASIDVDLDGFSIDDFDAPPGTDSYQKTFSQAGEAGPGNEHTLTVTANDQNGNPHSSVTQWTDAT